MTDKTYNNSVFHLYYAVIAWLLVGLFLVSKGAEHDSLKAVCLLRTSSSAGSGVVVHAQDRTAWVVTVSHLYDGQAEPTSVQTWNGRNQHVYQATVEHIDWKNDLALLRFDCETTVQWYAQLATAAPSMGQTVTTKGCPGGQNLVVNRTGRVVSTTSRVVHKGLPALTHIAGHGVKSGESGCPVYHKDLLVGIVWGSDGNTTAYTPLPAVRSLMQKTGWVSRPGSGRCLPPGGSLNGNNVQVGPSLSIGRDPRVTQIQQDIATIKQQILQLQSAQQGSDPYVTSRLTALEQQASSLSSRVQRVEQGHIKVQVEDLQGNVSATQLVPVSFPGQDRGTWRLRLVPKD